jgi:hypothetical protein
MQTETLRLAELALHALGDAVAIDANLVARAEQLEAELEGLLALARLIDELRQVEVRRDGSAPSSMRNWLIARTRSMLPTGSFANGWQT